MKKTTIKHFLILMLVQMAGIRFSNAQAVTAVATPQNEITPAGNSGNVDYKSLVERHEAVIKNLQLEIDGLKSDMNNPETTEIQKGNLQNKIKRLEEQMNAYEGRMAELKAKHDLEVSAQHAKLAEKQAAEQNMQHNKQNTK